MIQFKTIPTRPIDYFIAVSEKSSNQLHYFPSFKLLKSSEAGQDYSLVQFRSSGNAVRIYVQSSNQGLSVKAENNNYIHTGSIRRLSTLKESELEFRGLASLSPCYYHCLVKNTN